jgi:hypothetical protein
MRRRVSEPLNEGMRQNLQRLCNFSASLARAAESDSGYINEILNGQGRLPKNCESRKQAALVQLRHVEKYLEEVVAAVADIRTALRD